MTRNNGQIVPLPPTLLAIGFALLTSCNQNTSPNRVVDIQSLLQSNKLVGTWEWQDSASGAKLTIKVSTEKYTEFQPPTDQAQHSVFRATTESGAIVGFGFLAREGRDYLLLIKTKAGAQRSYLPAGTYDETYLITSMEGDVLTLSGELFISGGHHELYEIARVRRVGD